MINNKKCDRNFQYGWLYDSKFVSWLKKHKDLPKTYCMLCMKIFPIAKHFVKALDMPTSGSKHSSKVPVDSQTSLRFANKEDQARH